MIKIFENNDKMLDKIINTCGDGKWKKYEGKNYIEWKKLDYNIVSEEAFF